MEQLNETKKPLISGLFVFDLFIFLSILVSQNLFVKPDLDSTLKIQDKIPELLTTPFSLFSIVGTAESASLILLLIMFVFPLLRKISVLIFYVFIGIIEVIGKSIITQSGPPIYFLKTNLHLNFPTNNIPHEFFSYPSGHSARTAFISGVLIYALLKSSIKKEIKYVLVFFVLAFDFIMFLSRV